MNTPERRSKSDGSGLAHDVAATELPDQPMPRRAYSVSDRPADLVAHIERYFERLSAGEIPAKDKPPAECHGLLSACLQELRRTGRE